MNSSALSDFRYQFPLLKKIVNGRPLIYFDNAATTQKPASTIDSFGQYFEQSNANVHRSSHALSAESTTAFEQARQQTQQLINAKHLEEIIWTKGATESINLIAHTWGEQYLSAGDEIIISEAEHHANIVPWQLIALKKGVNIKVLPITATGVVDLVAFKACINDKTKLVCVNHVSNVVGKTNSIDELIAIAKAAGLTTVIDGSQAVAHQRIDVQAMHCDFYVFSAHKMFGPTGLGVLYGKKALLEALPPYQAGGEMIKTVSFEQTTFAPLPFKFEAGTPNIAGVIAFSNTINFLNEYRELVHEQEQRLRDYMWAKLSVINGINFVFEEQPDIPLFSFTIENHHSHDIASTLDSYGIAIRNGHHCAMPLMSSLNLPGCLRVSLAAYNTFEEIDFFIEVLTNVLSQEGDRVSEEVVANNLNAVHDVNDISCDIEDPIKEAFDKAKSWDEKHRALMLLGKAFARMDKSLRTENNLIQGCESLAWLNVTELAGVYTFLADSDAKVIRGLLSIVVNLVNGKTRREIQAINFDDYFQALGLFQHLSPSRGNGLKAIVEKVKQI